MSGVSSQKASYGSDMLYKWLIKLLEYVDIKVLYVFTSVFIIPFTLVLSRGARITFHYYYRIRGYGKAKSLVMTYRNHCLFAQTVIDKFAMYAGKSFRINIIDDDEYKSTTNRPQALLQLSAHIGCSEILGYSYKPNKKCNVLAYGGEQQGLMNYRNESFNKMNIHIIPVGTSEPHTDEIVNAFERGEIICAFADRYFNREKVISSAIFGRAINYSRSVLSLATTRGVDVIMASAMKENNGSYTAFFTALRYDRNATQKQQRQQLADAYSKEIERLMEKYPEQWFNYFNSWKDS